MSENREQQPRGLYVEVNSDSLAVAHYEKEIERLKAEISSLKAMHSAELKMRQEAEDLSDRAIEDRLMSMMEEEHVKLFMYFLAVKGRQMVAANATDLTVSQHMNVEGKRYKITCASTIEPVNL